MASRPAHHQLMKSKSAVAVVRKTYALESDASISFLFQNNFRTAFLRITDEGILEEFLNEDSKVPTNTYDLSLCWIDQSIERGPLERRAERADVHELVLVRQKGGPPICLRLPTTPRLVELQAVVSRFTITTSDDPDLESFQSPTVLSSVMGRILAVNTKLVRLFGYESEADLLGENVKILADPKVAKSHDGYLHHYHATGEKKMMNNPSMQRAVDAKGKIMPLMLYLGRFSTADGREERLIASFVKRSGSSVNTPDKLNRNVHRASSHMIMREKLNTVSLDVIDLLCTHIELHGCDTEGVFRLSGSAAEVDKLVKQIMVQKSVYDIDLTTVNLHVVTGALKKYLSEPLIKGYLYDQFVVAAQEQSPSKRLEKLLDCVLAMPLHTMAIFKRLWMLFGQICARSRYNKMNDQNLGICMSPLLTNPRPEVLLEHMQVFSDIFSLLITQYDRVYDLFPSHTPTGDYRIFVGPPAIEANALNLLLSNADRKSYPSGDMTILEEGTVGQDMYYVQEGRVVLYQKGVLISCLVAGQIFAYNSFLGLSDTFETAKSGKDGCVVLRINSSYVSKLFDIEAELCMKFCWEGAETLCNQLLSLPMAYLDEEPDGGDDSTTELLSSENPTEFPVHLSDGRVHIFEFHPVMTVGLMVEVLRRTYPKESKKNPCLFEKIGETTLQLLKPSDQMGALQVRCNFANATYKVIYPVQKDKGSGKKRASKRRGGSASGSSLGGSDGGGGGGGSDGSSNVNLLESEKKDKSVLIKEFPNSCKFKKKMGSLVLLHNCMIHTSTNLLGFESRNVLMYNSVKNVGISKGDNKLLLDANLPGQDLMKYQFREAAVCSEVFDLLRSLCRDTNIVQKAKRSESADHALELSQLAAIKARPMSPIMAVTKKNISVNGAVVQEGAIVQITQGLGSFMLRGRLVGKESVEIEVPSEAVDVLKHVWCAEVTFSRLQQMSYARMSRMPTASDWERILSGSKVLRVKPGERIVQEGSKLQRLYQVLFGICRVERRVSSFEEDDDESEDSSDSGSPLSLSNKTVTMRYTSGYLGPGDIFGAAGLLTGVAEEAVVAHGSRSNADEETDVVVAIIEARHIKAICGSDAALASRFYKYLMTLMHIRVRMDTKERVQFAQKDA